MLLSEHFPTQWTYFQGALFIIVMVFLPGGLSSLGSKLKGLIPERATKVERVEADAEAVVPA